MLVAMVHVGEMRVFVRKSLMMMYMRVRLDPVPRESMFMLMVCIMRVRVTVMEHLMGMAMHMALREVQCDAGEHEQRRQPEARCSRLMQCGDGDERAEKRGGRKICARAGRAQAAQCQNE